MAEARLGTRASRTLLTALLALGGCASEHPAPYDCDVDPSSRPLGQKILPFIAWVRSRPVATIDEFRERDALLAEDGASFMQRRGDELRDTRDFLLSVPRGIVPEFANRDAQLTSYIERQGDRLREDTHCFLTRAWNSLKLIE